MNSYHYLSLAILLLAMVSVSEAQTCDPNTASSDQYPGILTSLTVVQTSPIKLRATFRLFNSTKKISFEGMLFWHYGMDSSIGTTACRSLGCSVANGITGIGWNQKRECQFTCPDGASAMQTCRFLQSYMDCPADAMSLIECVKQPFWAYAGYGSDRYSATHVICTECGP